MQKLIGVTSSVYTLRSGVEGIFSGNDYSSGVLKAGGIPLVIPMIPDGDALETLAERLDGLILTGGVDLDPAYFGEEPIPQLGEVSPVRDQVEWKLTEEFLKRDKPIFAICRGVQVLNVVAGGTLYQDINAQIRKALQHMQRAPRWHASHTVEIKPGTLLHNAFGQETIRVNSYHHQAIKRLAPGFIVSGTASDGIIEAIESQVHRYVMGVQWHPENMWRRDAVVHNLFQKFVDHC